MASKRSGRARVELADKARDKGQNADIVVFEMRADDAPAEFACI